MAAPSNGEREWDVRLRVRPVLRPQPIAWQSLRGPEVKFGGRNRMNAARRGLQHPGQLRPAHQVQGSPSTLGATCTVGHLAVLHGCTIGWGSLVGHVRSGNERSAGGRSCLIGAKALVPEGLVVPNRAMVLGVPVKVQDDADAGTGAERSPGPKRRRLSREGGAGSETRRSFLGEGQADSSVRTMQDYNISYRVTALCSCRTAEQTGRLKGHY